MGDLFYRWIGLAAGLAILLAPRGARAEPVDWVVASIAPDGSPAAKLCDQLLETARKQTGAPLRFKRRYSGVLGSEIETVRLLQQGRVQAFCGSLGAVVPTVPELRYLELPFLFPFPDLPTWQSFSRAWQRGRTPDVQSLFLERGLYHFGWGYLGWRNFASVRKPISSPDDLRGVATRAQPTELHQAILRAYGAVPHPAALTDLSNTFDAGLTEVVDVPIIYLFGTSLDAKIHHYTASRHIMQLGVFLIARPAWEQVSAGRKLDAAVIDRVFLEAEAAHDQLDRELIADLKRRGVQVTELSADGRRRFMAAGEPVTEWVKRSATPRERALFERTRAWLQQHGRVRR